MRIPRVVWVLMVLGALVLAALVYESVSVYHGLNTGVVVGNVGGCEIVGSPGCWTGYRN